MHHDGPRIWVTLTLKVVLGNSLAENGWKRSLEVGPGKLTAQDTNTSIDAAVTRNSPQRDIVLALAYLSGVQFRTLRSGSGVRHRPGSIRSIRRADFVSSSHETADLPEAESR